jgi:hypothetical protein
MPSALLYCGLAKQVRCDPKHRDRLERQEKLS